ncbi:MAG: 23S rRNA (adenine(2503)-C(2))-methyltransferase RlmN, partial [Nitrospinota bacterium]
LRSGEIVDQILQSRKCLAEGERLTNLVFMGMGEPLDNYTQTVKALRIITAPEGLAISPRRITISTAGLVPAIEALGREGLAVNLAISLNASDEETRTRLMPLNRKYSMTQLLRACRNYPLPQRRRITFEYVLLAGINDSLEDARRVARLLRGLRCKINLIPFNEVEGLPFRRPNPEVVLAFQRYLQDQHYSVFIRESRGREISAACGQLAAPRSGQGKRDEGTMMLEKREE